MSTPYNPYGNDGQNENNSQGDANPYGGSSYDQSANGAYNAAGSFPTGGGVNQPMGERPKNQMAFSIILTVLSVCICCLPIGAVGLYFSTQVNKKWDMGDQAGSLAAAKNARTANIVVSCIIGAMVLLNVVGQMMGWMPDYEQLMNEYK